MSHIAFDGDGELHITDIDTARTIDKTDIDRVITVCQDSITDNVSHEKVYSHYNMSDGCVRVEDAYGGSCEYELFEEAADELLAALQDEESVLIHCHMGTSRSVSVACAALAVHMGWRRDKALDRIHHYHPRDSYPAMMLMDHARDYIDNKS